MAVVTNRQNSAIEFIVKPKNNLYLDGTLRRLPRVKKGEAYPCQMQKNQSFSCLFRHYAKHNGLRKEDLIFTFCDELLPDQTPETVHLMPQDEIWVEQKISRVENEKKTDSDGQYFSEQFRRLLEVGIHSDVLFVVGESNVEIPSHKAILSARSEYFQAMFREGGMYESIEKKIRISHDPSTFRRMLEFIYTNKIKDIELCCANEIINLLVMANEYLLQELRCLCEKAAIKVIASDNVTKLLLLSARHNASLLRDACSNFVSENRGTLAHDPLFRAEVENSPQEIAWLLFETSVAKPSPTSSHAIDSCQSSSAALVSTSHVNIDGNLSTNSRYEYKRRRILESSSENEAEMLPPSELSLDTIMNSTTSTMNTIFMPSNSQDNLLDG